MTPVMLEPAAPRSPVKHSTTEPLCSLTMVYTLRFGLTSFNLFNKPNYDIRCFQSENVICNNGDNMMERVIRYNVVQ